MQVREINTLILVTFTLEALPCPVLSNCLCPTATLMLPFLGSYCYPEEFLVLISSFGLLVFFTLVRESMLNSYTFNSRASLRNHWLLSSIRQHVCLPVRALLSDFLAGTYKAKDCDHADQAPLCLQCPNGTFTAVDNTMSKCFQCTHCRTRELPTGPEENGW